MKKRSFVTYWGLFVCLVISLFHSAQVFAQPKGAVCIINADQQIVVVDEILTGKVSLPAGTVGDNEPPQLAAQREAWEETGLVVTVGKELGRNESAVFYQCVSDSDIIAFQHQSLSGGRVLPNWFAPHYGIEVSASRLIDPAALNPKDYRYPEQWALVQALFSQTESQPVSYVSNLFDAAPSYSQIELKWIVSMQSWVGNLAPTISQFVDSFLLTGLVFTSSWWLLLLLPASYAYFQRDFTLKLLFTLIVASLLVQVGQLGFAQPRPFVYLPLLEKGTGVGFSLPNLALALWAVAVTLLLKRGGLWGWNKIAIFSVAILVWLSTALVYSASAFVLDCFAGLLLGWLCAWHMTRLDKQIGKESEKLFYAKGVWLLAMGASGILLLWWQTPSLLTLAMTTTLMLIVILFAGLPERVTLASMIRLVLLLVITWIGLEALHTQLDSSNLHSLLVEVMRWPMLVLVSVGYLKIDKTKA
ncbi:MutT/nudix family protein [Vibrio ichthyoenteri ATCC 700023]|uniref:MutT/nudix family protein n=1 Tax=Vibrio ichthyoenteri ATCC 700023 TaxID=870968 RepID=F9S2K1_9VIBR|nr:NUDIX domain-containing protein [Vibrio ichthyoenteri]EGU39547.1 MutT/nudix family protein [Vibrio ichthyoenteri ATCC 700023]